MATEPDISALRLFWWQGVPNFGDVLSRDIVAYVSGRPVVHAAPAECDLFAIGSLMRVVRRTFHGGRAPRALAPVIWGTGMLGHVRRDFLDHVEMAALRGPISAALLDVKDVSFGDPGLLASKLYAAPPRSDRIGLVPHHSETEDPAIKALAASDPVYDLIDVRNGPAEVCRRIAGCAQVFASSLHGLIVADAYGVPSGWVGTSSQNSLKYLDYAASVQRAFPAPLTWSDVPGAKPTAAAKRSVVAALQAGLIQSFPARLRAVTESVPV